MTRYVFVYGTGSVTSGCAHLSSNNNITCIATNHNNNDKCVVYMRITLWYSLKTIPDDVYVIYS